MNEVEAFPDPMLRVHAATAHADSRVVANAFQKQHKNVIRDIRSLNASPAGHGLSFEPMFEYVVIGNGARRKSLFFLMDEEAFAVLVMGFTGDRALAVKRVFIRAFQDMADRLRRDERNLAEMMRDWEIRERESVQRGSIGAKALCTRKVEKPALEAEKRNLLAVAQMTLKLDVRDAGQRALQRDGGDK
jgi:Rha family phage regulatory protein